MDANLEKSIEETRYLNYDDTWNVEGLIASRKETDGDIVVCPVTDHKLYFYRESGAKILLETYGVCYNCEGTFHRDALAFNDGVQRSKYPVVYKGCWCKECDALPESEWRETKEMLANLAEANEEPT